MNCVKNLSHTDVEYAKLLASDLSAAEPLASRMQELIKNPGWPHRHLIMINNLPRVHVDDVENAAPIIHKLIDFPAKHVLGTPNVVTLAFEILDVGHGYQLSNETLASGRLYYHRHEADKLRLLWSYFVNMTKRAKFSPWLKVFQLKSHYLNPDVQPMPALHLLPEFPAETITPHM